MFNLNISSLDKQLHEITMNNYKISVWLLPNPHMTYKQSMINVLQQGYCSNISLGVI